MNQKQEAKALQQNQLLNDIFAQCEHDIISQWRSAATIEEREQCSTDLRALESLRESIYAKVTDLLSEERKA